jgi:hypothetical protein
VVSAVEKNTNKCYIQRFEVADFTALLDCSVLISFLKRMDSVKMKRGSCYTPINWLLRRFLMKIVTIQNKSTSSVFNKIGFVKA